MSKRKCRYLVGYRDNAGILVGHGSGCIWAMSEKKLRDKLASPVVIQRGFRVFEIVEIDASQFTDQPVEKHEVQS